MSQLNAYLEALLPEPVTVLGFTLKPFCLGHLNLIQRMECDSFLLGFAPTPEGVTKYTLDFLATILVCAMTYEEAKEAFDKDVLTVCEKHVRKDGTFTETFRKASFREYVARWSKELEEGCSKGSINVLEDMGKVQQYVKDAFEGPESYPIENNGGKNKTSGAPWEQGLRDFLLTKYSESEAMNLPLSLAFWEWTKEAENNRQVSIKSEADMNAVELLKKMKV